MILHEKLDFPLAPKKFKKVKTISVRIATKDGENASHDITIYMWLAETPTFHAMLPREYYDVWKVKYELNHNWRVVKAADGVPDMVQAASFQEVVNGLERISWIYSEYIKSASIEKVIVIGASLVNNLDVGKDRVSYQPPTFSEHQLNLGLTAEICYRVNGHIYQERDGRDMSVPLAMDELYLHERRHGVKVLLYSDEAWETLNQVQASMKRAIHMIHSLMKSEELELLLKGGNLNLLKGPE